MSALRGVRVLVVENDDMNAMLLEMQLIQAGAAVVGPVGEVDDALQLIEADAPDTAVLDYRLGNGQPRTGCAAAHRTRHSLRAGHRRGQCQHPARV